MIPVNFKATPDHLIATFLTPRFRNKHFDDHLLKDVIQNSKTLLADYIKDEDRIVEEDGDLAEDNIDCPKLISSVKLQQFNQYFHRQKLMKLLGTKE